MTTIPKTGAKLRLAMLATLIGAAAACNDADSPAGPATDAAASASGNAVTGAVYTMTNAPSNNEVLVFPATRTGRSATRRPCRPAVMAVVSSYAIANDGSVALQHAIAASTGAGSGPIDMALSGNGQFLFVLAPGNGTVRPYFINPDGTLTGLGPISGVPGTAFGMAAS